MDLTEIVQECKLWEEIIRSNDDYLDRYTELDPEFLQYGKVRDAIIFTALGPEDYRYDPDTSTELKDFPKALDAIRLYRTLDILEETRLDLSYLGQGADHINAVLGFLYWAIGEYVEAVEALDLQEEPTRLAKLTVTALSLGIPGYFAPSN